MEAPIAVHPYYKIERELTHEGQKTIFHHRKLCLYAASITTRYRAFPVREVYDISFRRMGKEGGILYLHTRQGVYPYNVQTDPLKFIHAYKELTGRR